MEPAYGQRHNSAEVIEVTPITVSTRMTNMAGGGHERAEDYT